MSKAVIKEKEDAYSQAVSSGLYRRETGLHGKYDNVRIFWEDEITRIFLGPYITDLVSNRIDSLQRISILDLGCGSGDGYEMLMSIGHKDPSIYGHEVRVILPENLSRYVGLDLNQDLLDQNAERWGKNPKMQFFQGDFSDGLPAEAKGEPFDIYFTSFGALSHLTEDQTVKLFADIVNNAKDGSLIIGDWLGRYTYEWQQLWDADTKHEKWMDYVISYIYPPGTERPDDLAHLNLRLLALEEVENIFNRTNTQTSGKLELKKIFDRSIFVGRHIDTHDYNSFTTPLRRAVNSLHENNQRTNLNDLLIDYRPDPEFELLNRFFELQQSCWNALIRYTIEICKDYDDENHELTHVPPIHGHYPKALQDAMNNMRRVVEGVGWFQYGDSRANVIEPQLGYALRSLEINMQQGIGASHGLVGIFQVNKG